MKIQVKGIHHIVLRVNDMERSRRFYQDVLGFDVVQAAEDLCYFQVGLTLVVLHPPLEGTLAGDRFSEYRIGIDHMAFAVEERGELDKVVRILRQAGVHTEGVELDPTLNKEYVCFRDPDNVQWEFYMLYSGGAARRRAQLHAIARAYVTEGLAKKNFDAIPYDANVTLRAPLTPGGSDVPLVGKENLRGFWWAPLSHILGDARLIGTYINEDMTAVTCEFRLASSIRRAHSMFLTASP
jgi:glyoxylase I family protein